MKNKQLTKLAYKLSDGLLGSVTDLVLFVCFLTLSSVGKQPTYFGIDKAFLEANKELSKINYQVIKRCLVNLKQKKYVSYQRKRLKGTLEITKEGRQRLYELIPTYKKKRTWDGRIYLITYDIPEKQKSHREILRKYIKKLGGAMLQESVWLLVYNPRDILRTFIEERQLAGVVIISDMGQDAVIGENNIRAFLHKIYKLDELNARYQEFISEFNKKKINQLSISKYLSILKDDPQLPFQLLSTDWLGNKAYHLCQNSLNKFNSLLVIS